MRGRGETESEENIMGLVFLTYHRGDALFVATTQDILQYCSPLDYPHNNKKLNNKHQSQGKVWAFLGKRYNCLRGPGGLDPFDF
mmetsp:Transcript_8116/g.17412  ORF Transcript_8116/g.17412 Transcript_8116/m.17412 type:complete len:84 (-) Transcript_8116:1678-1929(-)